MQICCPLRISIVCSWPKGHATANALLFSSLLGVVLGAVFLLSLRSTLSVRSRSLSRSGVPLPVGSVADHPYKTVLRSVVAS